MNPGPTKRQAGALTIELRLTPIEPRLTPIELSLTPIELRLTPSIPSQTYPTNVSLVVEHVVETAEGGEGVVVGGKQGERPFPSQASDEAGCRHGAGQRAQSERE